ncbi:MAG: PQQ-binding-like beta-propeller repeat protein, partial [Bradymonadia bacterium]
VSLVPDDSISMELGYEMSIPIFTAEGDVLFIGSRTSGLHAFKSSNGELLWRTAVDGGVVSQAAVASDLVLVGTGAGELSAFARSTGHLRWSVPLKGMVSSTPVLFGNEVIVRDGTNTLYAFDQQTGEWRWQYSRDVPARYSAAGVAPLFVASGLLYAGLSDGTLLCLDATKKGRLVWELSLGSKEPGFQDIDANLVFYRQYLVAASISTGLAFIDTRRGKVMSRIAKPLIVAQVPIDDHLVLANGDGEIYRLNPNGGELVWKTQFAKDLGAPQTLIANDGLVYVTFPLGGLTAIDANDGLPIFGLDPGHGVTGVAFDARTQRIALLTNRGTLFVLSPSSKRAMPENSWFKPLTTSAL